MRDRLRVDEWLPPLAVEGDELVVAAVAAAKAQESVLQNAALEKRVELVLDELR